MWDCIGTPKAGGRPGVVAVIADFPYVRCAFLIGLWKMREKHGREMFRKHSSGR